MKKTNNGKPEGCNGLECHTTVILIDDGTPIYACADGGTDCGVCKIVEVEISDFHDKHLQKATTKIKKILADIPPDARKRKLSFIHTKKGFVLAWLDHGARVPNGAKVITQKDDEKAFLKYLKIKKGQK
jgi:hypothetical protein